MEIEFKPDPYLYVAAETAEKARKFFGTPTDWPVSLVNRSKDDIAPDQKVWAVPIERWVSVSPGSRYKEKLILL